MLFVGWLPNSVIALIRGMRIHTLTLTLCWRTWLPNYRSILILGYNLRLLLMIGATACLVIVGAAHYASEERAPHPPIYHQSIKGGVRLRTLSWFE